MKDMKYDDVHCSCVLTLPSGLVNHLLFGLRLERERERGGVLHTSCRGNCRAALTKLDSFDGTYDVELLMMNSSTLHAKQPSLRCLIRNRRKRQIGCSQIKKLLRVTLVFDTPQHGKQGQLNVWERVTIIWPQRLRNSINWRRSLTTSGDPASVPVQFVVVLP